MDDGWRRRPKQIGPNKPCFHLCHSTTTLYIHLGLRRRCRGRRRAPILRCPRQRPRHLCRTRRTGCALLVIAAGHIADVDCSRSATLELRLSSSRAHHRRRLRAQWRIRRPRPGRCSIHPRNKSTFPILRAYPLQCRWSLCSRLHLQTDCQVRQTRQTPRNGRPNLSTRLIQMCLPSRSRRLAMRRPHPRLRPPAALPSRPTRHYLGLTAAGGPQLSGTYPVHDQDSHLRRL